MIAKYIDIFYYVIILLLALKSIFFTKRIDFAIQSFLGVYIIVTAILEMYCLVIFKIDNKAIIGFWYNIYCFFCILFFRYYYRNIFKNRFSNIIFISSILFYLIFTKFYSKEFDIKIGILISLYYIFCSLVWFYKKISSINEAPITNDPDFWVSTGILMWSSFFIFRVIPMFFLRENDQQFLDVLRTIQNFINILMYLMFFIAMIKYERKQRYS